jgi:hypothetical protein
LIVIGSLQPFHPGEKHEIFAPTSSGAANRYLAARAASEGMTLKQFDITTAFLN